MVFVILPDQPAGTAIEARLPDSEKTHLLSHASGRPWIAGNWSERDVVAASAGDNAVAVFGSPTVSAERLAGKIGAVRTVHDMDVLARSLPGCFHLIVSIGGRVGARGSLSTARQIFHGSVDGVTVAADRPQAVAALTGAGVDEELLALQLLTPYGPPWPLNDRCVWRGVRALTLGHRLEIGRDGRSRTARSWTPPAAEVPLTAGRAVLRQALETAVDARTAGGGIVSADLSGGKDSTSLCFLAARSDVPLVTVHLESSDPANEDRIWAARSREKLPKAQHLIVPMESTPGKFAESTTQHGEDIESPTSLVCRPMLEHVAQLVSSHGSAVHLQGIGSDELFLPSVMSTHALARSRPLGAFRNVRELKSMRRWTWLTTARNLLRGPTYPQWLGTVADTITADRAWGAEVDWEIAPRMPPWATADAVDAVRRLLREAAAESPEPLAPLPVHHEMLRLTQINGGAVRGTARIGERYGVSFQAPFMDDRVIEAAMSIRLEDRTEPERVKPVLAAALRGVVPDDLLDRRSKADASPELYIGLRRHRRRLTELFDDSYLARLGLVDVDGIRTVVGGLHMDVRPLAPLERTLANERWLRSLPSAARPAGAHHVPRSARGAS
ncbi:asparagine synthase-related protein [Streptomyces sp. NPDC058391]|uniref:asparagine synthase-related protein n=1 Tax=Streptomyces sp. NPDC058391 TaxID=3346476 RepID=UPI0036650B4C